MTTHRFLITGAMGCVGAWTVRRLLEEDASVTIFDLSDDERRPRQLLSEDQLTSIDRIRGDITDFDQVMEAVAGKTHVIHLAALQVPFVRANPVVGAEVNVTGTVNIFEAVKRERIDHLVYASSVAVYGHPDKYVDRILGADALRLPDTLYGVFKVANEDTAKVYWAESSVPSIGLRPHTVYGPGRDQGVTAAPTLALAAAVKGEPYHIPYGGIAGFNFVRDTAETLIAASRVAPDGGHSYSLSGDIASVAKYVEISSAVTGTRGITYEDTPLPFPDGLEDTPLTERLGSVPHTPLREAIEETAAFFRAQDSDR